MERRTVLTGLTALAAASMTQALAAESMKGHEHHMHHHHGGNKYQALIDATAGCLNAGEICLAHCIQLLGEGDTSMAECARNVNQMLAVCRAAHELAAQESSFLPAMAKIAAETCKACMQACKKHADKHQQCKDCMNSCESCAKECSKASA